MTDRPKMGRPARAGGPAQRRSLRATAEEWALWQDAAEKAGMDLSDWMRAAADAHATRRAITVRVQLAPGMRDIVVVDEWSTADAVLEAFKAFDVDAAIAKVADR